MEKLFYIYWFICFCWLVFRLADEQIEFNLEMEVGQLLLIIFLAVTSFVTVPYLEIKYRRSQKKGKKC